MPCLSHSTGVGARFPRPRTAVGGRNDDAPARPNRPRSARYVYLAHRAIDEPNFVTVKVLNAPHVSAGFLDSVRDTSRRLSAMAPADTSHLLEPGVTTDGRVYVVAKYIPGPSITDYVTRRHCNSLDRVRLGERVCSLVADLHRHGITHGSIKSSNVIVVETPGGPLPVLLDTGIVPAISESRQRRDQVDGGGSATNGERAGRCRAAHAARHHPGTSAVQDARRRQVGGGTRGHPETLSPDVTSRCGSFYQRRRGSEIRRS